MKFTITPEQSGERVDKFLVKELKKFSRSQLQKLIKEGSITVNDKNISSHYRLKANDYIKIINVKTSLIPTENIGQTEVRELRISPAPKNATNGKGIKIIDDTSEYIIINKPAGLIVHGAPHIKEKTLADLILKKYPQMKKVGDEPNRPGIVHRLDKEVSGLIVLAKTQDSFLNLKKQFKERRVKKEYIALVYGKIKKESGEISFPIKRSTGGHKMAALPLTMNSGIEGRRAITEFEVIKKFINYTLIKLIIKTGRTHQIRVHLSACGHPIVGDNLYSTKKTRELNKKLGLARIFLVATELSFIDLADEKKEYKIDLPANLKNILNQIK